MASQLRLMGVHAHADDETITMGGTLAVSHDRGVLTSVICCTDGKNATIVAEDMPEETTRPRLAEIRQGELRKACGILGVDEVHFLEYGDSGMAGADTNSSPESFWQANVDQAVTRLVAHIRRFRPHVVITYDAVGGYGHPDHIQTHRVTLLAIEAARIAMYPEQGEPWTVEKLYYTAFPTSLARKIQEISQANGIPSFFGDTPIEDLPFLTPDHLVTATVDCSEGLTRKREALRAHHSQIGEDWPLLAMPEEFQREHFPHEFFQLAISRNPVPSPETDVFAGVTAEELATAK